MEVVNAHRVGITLKDYKRRVANEWYIYAEDNIEENTLEEIAVIKCSKGLIKDKRRVKVRSFFGSYTIIMSACPLAN